MEQFFQNLPTWGNIALFALGMAIITKGADVFTDSAIRLAEITHVPKVIIGATVVSMATTFPEFSVSFIATLLNRPQTAIGNSIGSTICNIGLILATCVLVKSIFTDRKAVRNQGAFMLAAGLGMIIFTRGGYLPQWAGPIFMIGLALYLWSSYAQAMKMRKEHKNNQAAVEDMTDIEETFTVEKPARDTIVRELVLILIGGMAVAIGSILLVQNAAIIARWLGVPELIIAVTLVALGTSLPEYVTSLTATFKGHGDLGVGNIIGANVLDIFWVLGACAFVRPLPIERQTMVLDFPVMFILMVLIVLFAYSKSILERWEGGTLFAIYGVYLAIMLTVFA